MNFSNDTEIFMKRMIDDFQIYMKSSPVAQNGDSLDSILLSLYQDIKASRNFIKYIYKFKPKIRRIPLKVDKDLFSSRYIPQKIRREIGSKERGVINYVAKLKGHDININFIIFDEVEYDKIKKYNNYVSAMLIWLNMAFMCSSCLCSQKLEINIYPSISKKELPSHVVKIINVENCNTAVTTGCVKHAKIIIFRQEEWFKVFIHESFHSLGLDFVNMDNSSFLNKIKGIYPLEINDWALYESYTEFWATIMNCLFGAYYLLDDDDSEVKKREDFLLYSYFCIQFEQFFSLFQCVKILKFMGLRYDNLLDNVSPDIALCRKTLYKEKTHVFSYYILKCILLYYYCDFLGWCRRNNCNTYGFIKTPNNLNNLFKFIEERYKREDLLQQMNKMYELFLKIRELDKNDNKLLKTMRMTICEWDPMSI